MKHRSVSPQQTLATSSWSHSPRPAHLCSPYKDPGILSSTVGGHQATHSTRLQMGGQQVRGPERVTRGDAPALPPPTVQTRAGHKPCQDQPRWTALFRSQGGSRTQRYTPHPNAQPYQALDTAGEQPPPSVPGWPCSGLSSFVLAPVCLPSQGWGCYLPGSMPGSSLPSRLLGECPPHGEFRDHSVALHYWSQSPSPPQQAAPPGEPWI